MIAFMTDAVERPRFANLSLDWHGASREQHTNTLTWIKCEPPDAVVR